MLTNVVTHIITSSVRRGEENVCPLKKRSPVQFSVRAIGFPPPGDSSRCNLTRRSCLRLPSFPRTMLKRRPSCGVCQLLLVIAEECHRVDGAQSVVHSPAGVLALAGASVPAASPLIEGTLLSVTFCGLQGRSSLAPFTFIPKGVIVFG